MHELGHGHVFKTKWLNSFFLRVVSISYVKSLRICVTCARARARVCVCVRARA